MSQSISARIDLCNYRTEIENICQSLSVDSSYYIRTVVHHVLESMSNGRAQGDINSDVAFRFDFEDELSLREQSGQVVRWISGILHRTIPPARGLAYLTLSNVSNNNLLYSVEITCKMAA
jgi:hypothetical protein